MDNTTTEKKLSKHLQAAVNQLEKQILILKAHREKAIDKRADMENAISQFDQSIDMVSEQIKRLKGETPAELLQDISKAGLK